jgi:hypothetical protein
MSEAKLMNRISELEEQKNSAYTERNKLVAALSKLYPASLGKHDANDLSWDRDWLNIVFIHTPHGQLSWHLHDSDVPMFSHLEPGTEAWDGHTTDEKYARLSMVSLEDQHEYRISLLRRTIAEVEKERDAALAEVAKLKEQINDIYKRL